jgi:hypothetical protein
MHATLQHDDPTRSHFLTRDQVDWPAAADIQWPNSDLKLGLRLTQWNVTVAVIVNVTTACDPKPEGRLELGGPARIQGHRCDGGARVRVTVPGLCPGPA